MPVRLIANAGELTTANGEMIAALPASSLIVPPERAIPVTVTPVIVESPATIVYSKLSVSVPAPLEVARSTWRVVLPIVTLSLGVPTTVTISLKVTANVSMSPVL